MRNLLVSDFFKLRKSMTFWLCCIMSLLSTIPMAISMEQSQFPNISGVVTMGSIGFNGYNLNAIFIATFISVFLSSEFSSGTMKNVLSRGLSRTKVFLSKLVVCGTASIFMMFVLMSASLLIGTIRWGLDSYGIAGFSGIGSMILTQSLLMCAYAALFTCVAITMRSAGAIAVNVLSILLVPNLLEPFTEMIFKDGTNLIDFWIGKAVLNVSTVTPLSNDVFSGIITALCWIIATAIIGIVLFRKRDLK